MIDLLLDQEKNDLVIENFDFHLVDAVDQITQNLSIRLKFILGEWFLDITQGVPYFERFFIKNPNQIQIESILKQEIIQTLGIDRLTSFEADFDKSKRLFSVKFSAKAISGDDIYKEMELPV